MKRFKAKKKKKKMWIFKLISILIITYMSFSFSLKYLFKKEIKDKVDNKVIINYLLKHSSNNLVELNKNNDLFDINLNSQVLLLKTV